MKKLICLTLAILVCASLAVPALAANFVPSITYKGRPSCNKIVVAIDGKEETVEQGCLRITPVSKANKLPEAEKELLQKVYKELSDGTMVLPYDKVEGINADKMVIRELLDVAFVCDHEHATKLKDEGVTVTLTFKLGVAKDDVLVAMTYVNDEWVPAVELVNNGDGSVTCTFEDLCPVAFAIEG